MAKMTGQQVLQRGLEARALSQSTSIGDTFFSENLLICPNRPKLHSAFTKGVGDKDRQINDEK